MSTFQANGSNVLTINANSTATISNLTIQGTGVYYAQPSFTVYANQYTPNALIPETPEVWLRRRVREVCELVAA